MLERRVLLLAGMLALSVSGVAGAAGATGAAGAVSGYGIGERIDPSALAAWDIDVSPDGHGLPTGSGTVALGKQIFAGKCAMCHGATGQGGIGDPLVGGIGSLSSLKPKKTVGSYWPYATTLFDYVRRAMPYNAPQSLSADEVYSVSAYLLFMNGIVPEPTRLDAKSLPKIHMPNRDGFVGDPRPGAL